MDDNKELINLLLKIGFVKRYQSLTYLDSYKLEIDNEKDYNILINTAFKTYEIQIVYHGFRTPDILFQTSILSHFIIDIKEKFKYKIRKNKINSIITN